MTPTMSSSLCTFAALAGSPGRPGRRASQKGGNKRAVAQPLAAGAVTEAPPAVVAPPARPVISTPRRRERRTGDAGTDQLVAWKSIRQERWEGALEVEGELPLWLDGTYLRNGPGLWDLGDYGFRHLFDGYATLVRVSFRDGHAVGAHRQIESEAYKAAREHGKVCYREFSEVPKPEGFMAFVGQMAKLFSGSSLTDNSNTGVVRLGDGRVLCLTETVKGSIVVDPDTLETVSKFEYEDKLGGLIHSAHPIVTDTEFWTLIPDLIRPGYVVARMDAGSNERQFVGRVDCRGGPAPGWVHSFPITDNYVVVPEMPLRYCAANLLRAEPTPLYKFQWHWHPESGTYPPIELASSCVYKFLILSWNYLYLTPKGGERGGATVRDVPLHQRVRGEGRGGAGDGDHRRLLRAQRRHLHPRQPPSPQSPELHPRTSSPMPGWGGSGFRWTVARSASLTRRWTRRSTAAAWTCAASTPPTSARSTATPTPAGRRGRATSPTRSPRSTWWRRRQRTGTRRAPCRPSPTSCRAPAPSRKTTAWRSRW